MTAVTDDTSPASPQSAAPRAYRLLFAGELLPGFEEALVRTALARHLQRSPASLFSGKRVTVGEFAQAVEAEMARQAMQALGAKVMLEEVEAPPPMPALGLLDVALPSAPAAQPAPQENFAKTDSGWQPLGEGPAALPPLMDDLQDDLLKNLAATRAQTSPQAQEPTPVFAPVVQRPPPPPVATDLSSPVVTMAPTASAVIAAPVAGALSMAEPQPQTAAVPDASWIRCPACREHQPMRLLCRACGTDLKRALAAQQEERAQARASSVARAAANNKTAPRGAVTSEDEVRILGVRVPDDWAAKLTWPNVLLALFGSLLVLATIGYLWRLLGLDPIFSSSKPKAVVVAPAATDAALETPGTKAVTDKAALPPAPPEAEVAARLSSPAAVADFRSRYWSQATNKVFVYSSGGTTAWSGGQPSVARAMALAMTECESRRPATAAPCRVVNVNDYWQD